MVLVFAEAIKGQLKKSALEAVTYGYKTAQALGSECVALTLGAVEDAGQLGKYGAANGVLPDGRPVNPDDTHPLEVWTGINFGLAAFMIQMGMKNASFPSATHSHLYHNFRWLSNALPLHSI